MKCFDYSIRVFGNSIIIIVISALLEYIGFLTVFSSTPRRITSVKYHSEG